MLGHYLAIGVADGCEDDVFLADKPALSDLDVLVLDSPTLLALVVPPSSVVGADWTRLAAGAHTLL